MTRERCIDELLKRGADDWIHAAEVAWVAQSMCDTVTEAENRNVSIDLVRQVVEQGLMRLGDLKRDGFHEWNLGPQDSLRRVEGEWAALGRRPNLGELFWLANTQKGDERAQHVLKREKRGER